MVLRSRRWLPAASRSFVGLLSSSLRRLAQRKGPACGQHLVVDFWRQLFTASVLEHQARLRLGQHVLERGCLCLLRCGSEGRILQSCAVTFKLNAYRHFNGSSWPYTMDGTRARAHCMLLRATEDGNIELFLQMHSKGPSSVPVRVEDFADLSPALQSPAAWSATTSSTQANNQSECEWTLPYVEAGPAENLLIQTGTAGERRWGRYDDYSCTWLVGSVGVQSHAPAARVVCR